MSEALKVTKVTTDKDGVKTFWYNGAEPRPRKPPVNKGGYRVDVQKGRLYAAEREAFLGPFDGATNRQVEVDLPSLGHVERFVWKVTHDKWFVRRFGQHSIRVQDGRGMSKALGTGGGNMINIKRAGRARWIVLHELAHCLQPSGTQHHGPEFVKIFLALVRHFLGREAWWLLRDACKGHRVRMQVRRRRRQPLSSEQRAALVRRLEYGRQVAADRRAVEQAYDDMAYHMEQGEE